LRPEFKPRRSSVGDVVRLLTPDQLAEYSVGADLLILPDRIGADDDGNEWVAFVPLTQDLRVELQAKVRVRLARPSAMSSRYYEEHDTTVVLPIILPVAGAAAAAIVKALIAAWIKKRFGHAPIQTVRYRRARANAVTGKIEIIEVEGPADAAERLVQLGEDESLSQD
jgi:hypothetical protein